MTPTTSVYILGTGASLPNEPVENDRIEQVLGQIGNEPSRARRQILRSNGIKSRHYAIDPTTGQMSHTNAQLTVEAVRGAAGNRELDDIDCLACGTTTPDQLMPNHGLMVHGALGNRPCEVIATSGACLSGLTALKYATLSVASGASRNAVATGSEVVSAVMRAAHFPDGETPVEKLREDPVFAFGQDFLRWMLSDGAGAVWLSDRARGAGPVLKVEWVETVSFASKMETCMYWGAAKTDGGDLHGWNQAETITEAVEQGMLNFTQDARLLGREGSRWMVAEGLATIRERRPMDVNDIRWFLPHYSSQYFRQDVYDRLKEIDFEIPFERWFTNLTTKGNTGAASIYIMLDELVRSGNLEVGHQILCFVPESARFSTGYALLTVVEPDA